MNTSLALTTLSPAGSPDMVNDQTMMMLAFGQEVDQSNPAQAKLYLKLMLEELGETLTAANPDMEGRISRAISELEDLVEIVLPADDEALMKQKVGMFDGGLDVVVVTLGFMLSMGFPVPAGWAEVFRSNMLKVDPVTGMVRRREDGKVLKPEGWTPPDLRQVLLDHQAPVAG